MPGTERDYLTLLLQRYWFAPPVALWRAVELRVLAAEAFPRPILDLGCGDGLIADILFEDEPPIEVGFDPWWAQVVQAPATERYAAVQLAAGAAMPYADGSFATVFSNSVLEHIIDLAPVLREAARVLRPGGRFLATVPSDAFRQLLAGYRDRVAVGDFAGAEAYASRVDRELAHYRYPTPAQWAEMLAAAGMRLRATRYYIPAEVVALWDRANTQFGIGSRSWPLYRWLASPRLKGWGYQRWLKRQVVRHFSRRWRDAYTREVPEGGVGGGLLVIGEKI